MGNYELEPEMDWDVGTDTSGLKVRWLHILACIKKESSILSLPRALSDHSQWEIPNFLYDIIITTMETDCYVIMNFLSNQQLLLIVHINIILKHSNVGHLQIQIVLVRLHWTCHVSVP